MLERSLVLFTVQPGLRRDGLSGVQAPTSQLDSTLDCSTELPPGRGPSVRGRFMDPFWEPCLFCLFDFGAVLLRFKPN